MDGNAFIALAGKLAAAKASDEATYRTAVSRAYYGAFHVARLFLVELGFQPMANANVHAFVRHYLNGANHADAYRAAAHLGDLQTARNRADYVLDDPRMGSRDYARISVERAHQVVSAVETCGQDNTRDLLRKAIGEYERKIRPRPVN